MLKERPLRRQSGGEMDASHVPSMIVMGVSSSGKSTVGEVLAERLGIPFVDGDDLHPESNKEKMRSGMPLTDDDRWPWLHRVGEAIDQERSRGRAVAIACSALKRSYRDVLREHDPQALFVYLEGTRELIAERMRARHHEFMPTSLLDSQFAALEPLADDEAHVSVSIALSPDEMATAVISELPRFARE